MNIRPKTMRRLAILIVGCIIIAGAFTALYISSQKRAEARLLEERAAGMAAFAESDYATALARLSKYVSKRKDDPDALFAYAKSRARVEEPNNKHIAESLEVFRFLLDKPLNDDLRLQAQHMLLEMYDKAGYSTEAITLADSALRNHPDDLTALKYKATALARLRRFDEALATAKRRNELAPLDLEGQLHTLDLLHKLRTPGPQIIAHAEALRASHPDDPRFELLLGVAYGYTNDEANARSLLRAAASKKAPDAEFVTHLTRYFDNLRLFDDSQAVLERADRENEGDARIRQVLIERLWQSGRNSEVIKRLETLDPADPKSDSELLAFKALALYRVNRADEAKQIVATLAERKTDPVALAWATAIAARYADPPLETKEMTEQLQSALVRAPDNAPIRYMLGEAYEQLGETELALQAWQMAAEEAPSWSAPRVRRARTLTATGRTSEAMAEAHSAYTASPNATSAVMLAVTTYARLQETGDPADSDRLMRLVDEIQQKLPGEPETLPIYVSLLADKGETDKATEVIKRVLVLAQDQPQDTLLELAAVSRNHGLGLEKQILDEVAQTFGMTPALAYARAANLALEGKTEEGLKYLTTAAQDGKGDPLAWRMAIARYKDVIRHPTAAAEWRKLGDDNPNNLFIQNQILNLQNGHASMAWQDREFIARSIERLRALTGEDGTRTWKLARARWLLGQNNERESAEAVNLLTDIVRSSPNLPRPRVLLAQALEQVGNRARAIDELKTAVDQNPWSVDMTVSLARLLQAEGKVAQSRDYLTRLAKNAALDLPTRRRLAEMLVQVGDMDAAIALLTPKGAANGAAGLSDVATQLQLADLYRRKGDVKSAGAIFEQLLKNPTPPLLVLERSADFYAANGHVDRAEQIMAGVNAATAPEFEKLLALANFNERHVGDAEALSHFEAATTAAPSESRTWRELVGYYLRHGQYDRAVSAAASGLKLLPADADLQSLHANAQALASSPQPEDVQQLAAILSKDPENIAAAETLQSMRESHQKNDTPQQRVARLRELADKHARFLPVQLMLADGYLSLNQTREALEVATRAMQRFPNESSPAQLAVRIHAASHNWNEMLAAANQWRARSMEQPLQADLVIAEAHLRMSHASQAINQLAPYVEIAKANPKDHFATLVFYGRALIMAGRETEATNLLLPLTRDSAEWRDAWLNILSTSHRTPDAAIAWVERIVPFVPSDSSEPEQQFNLANGWYNVGQHYADKRGYERARAILEPMAQAAGADVPTILLYASASEQLGDLATAEAAYRRVLAIDSSIAVVKNNLAFVILQRDGDLTEARRLAQEAVATSPGTAGFYDTLARIQVKGGETETAIQNFEAARKIEPDSLEVLIGLADVLSQSGQRDRARPILRQIETLMAEQRNLPAPLQHQLDSLRSALSQSI